MVIPPNIHDMSTFTYTKALEMFGVPGYVYKMNDVNVKIMWVYEQEDILRYINMEFNPNGIGVGSAWIE